MLPFRPSVNRGNCDGITNVEIELKYTVIKTNTRLGTTIIQKNCCQDYWETVTSDNDQQDCKTSSVENDAILILAILGSLEIDTSRSL